MKPYEILAIIGGVLGTVTVILAFAVFNLTDITFFGLKLMPDNIWVLLENLAVAASLPFLGYELIQTTKATRDQEEEMVESRYQSLRDHHHELVIKQIDEPILLQVYKMISIPEAKRKECQQDEKMELTDEKDMKIFSYYIAEFDLYERVYYWFTEGDIDEYEWSCWLIYLEKMSHHWIFRYTYNQTRKFFDPGFMKEVWTIIDENDGASEYLEKRAKNAYERKKEKKLEIPPRIDKL